MTGQEMIDEIRDHEFDDLSDARILALLNDQYQDICSRYRWPFLIKTSTSVTVGTDGTLSGWPTDLAHIKSLYLNADTTFQNILAYNENFYLISGSVPQLDTSYAGQAVTLVYYQQPVNLTTTTSPIFPTRHHRAVVLGALARAYYMTDDAQLGMAFERQYEDRVQKMVGDLMLRDVAPRKFVDTFTEY